MSKGIAVVLLWTDTLWLRRTLVASVLLLIASANALAQNAAERAVEAAKQYAGTEITLVWQSGLQALDPLNFSGPKWTELTGIEVDVVEIPPGEIFEDILREYRDGSDDYDVLNIIPSWLPDLAIEGALEPLDPFIEKFGYRNELSDIAAVYRENQMTYDGTVFGIPDDGDLLLLYYRKDIFEENGLSPPRSWAEFSEIGTLLSQRYAPEMYGAAVVREPYLTQFMFQERFRVAGGRFFDAKTMKATVNSNIGREVLEAMRSENRFMPPGIESTGFVEAMSSFLTGQSAMTISWPPVGRWAAGYGTEEDALSWLPRTTVAGKVGYAIPPGGHTELAAGFSLGVSSSSKNKEAAYLFIQWLNSAEISLQRVQLPYALRDPFRTSHFQSEQYRSLWPDAPDYLDALQQSAEKGLLDLSLIKTDSYEKALSAGIEQLWEGEDVKDILDSIAAKWDEITESVGAKKQRKAYLDWASKPNAYPD